MLPPAAKAQAAADSMPTRHLHSSLNKLRHPINTVLWTPEGRRLLTGSSSGEFTLWNGIAFNFETIMQASMDKEAPILLKLIEQKRHTTQQFGQRSTRTVRIGWFQPTKLEW